MSDICHGRLSQGYDQIGIFFIIIFFLKDKKSIYYKLRLIRNQPNAKEYKGNIRK